MPSIAALAFKRRWNSDGTFRTCTIDFDMQLEYFHHFFMSTPSVLVPVPAEKPVCIDSRRFLTVSFARTPSARVR